MAGRIRRKQGLAEAAALAERTVPALLCALCGRPLGAKVEWHHAIPKAEGGRETVPVHPICHRTIHATVPNAELAREGGDFNTLRARPEIARFVAWVADKDPDFHAPTRRGRERGVDDRRRS
jgi:hypothetical protein